MKPVPSLLPVLLGILCISAGAAEPAAEPTAREKDSPQVCLLARILELPPTRAVQFVEKYGQAAPKQQGAILAEFLKQDAVSADPKHPRIVSLPAVTVSPGRPVCANSFASTATRPSLVARMAWPFPTAFETRNLGTMLEFEPRRTAEGKAWEVAAVFQTVQLAESKIYGAGQFAAEQPIFSTRKLDAKVRLQPGVPQLVGIIGPDPR